MYDKIFVNFVLNKFTLLAFTQLVDDFFHSFIVLFKKEYFPISNIHCSLTNVTSCSLVLPSCDVIVAAHLC